MLRSVRVRNFRAITDLKVDDLARVNLFVGNNASGKTTFLESVFFLIGATNPKLPVNVNTFRGFPYVSKEIWPTYFHNLDVGIPIEVEAIVSGRKRQLHLEIGPRYDRPRADGSASTSVSTSVDSAGSSVEASLNGLELTYSDHALSAGRPARHKSSVYVRDGEIFEEGNTEPSMRGTFVTALPLDLRGRFSDVQRKKRVSNVVTLLRAIEPAIEDIRLLDPPGVLYADTGRSELIPVDLMGGGIKRLLGVALAMLDFQNGYVLIDEIENGLGYSAQQTLWKAVFDWARKLDVQVFATTHSMECIRAFNDSSREELFGEDAKLYRIERSGDQFRSVEYGRDVLAESLESNWEVR